MQNLISASLTPEVKQEVLQKLTEIKSELNFLMTLQPQEVQGLVKVGNNFIPFLDKAYHAVNSHPEIMPQVFDVEEFKNDYLLSKDLMTIHDQIKQLAESLEKTMFAVSSDAMTESLEVYTAVKQHRDKVPGLNVVAEEMGQFFKRTRKREAGS